MDLIALAIPFFLLSILMEAGYDLWSCTKNKKSNKARRASYYRINDSINDLSLGILSQIVSVFLQVLLLALYWYTYEHLHIFVLSEDDLFTLILTFFAVDFSFYWFHRSCHERNIFWATHEPHHQSEEFNFSVALRQGAFEGVVSIWFKLPWAILGIPTSVFFAGSALNTIFQFFVHTRFIKRLGPLEWIFNTPSHHRVHHACNPKYLDCNYAGVLIIWDRMFGTFIQEEEEPTFGLVSPLHSWNPLYANTRYFATIITHCKTSPIQEWFSIIFIQGPSQMGVIPPKEEIIHRSKYNPPLSSSQKIYSILLFLVSIIALSCMLMPYLPTELQFLQISLFEQLFLGILLVALLYFIGFYMEKNIKQAFAK